MAADATGRPAPGVLRRPAMPRNPSSGRTTTRILRGGGRTMAVAPRIQLNDVNGVQVVRFFDRQLFDERTVREVADQILAALPNDGNPIRLVLDFTDINLVSSTLLSKLILLQRRVSASGGKLRLCELSPVIQQVFRTANLDRLFSIDRDQRTALDTFH
jgi:anti-sigma B factor antagonist